MRPSGVTLLSSMCRMTGRDAAASPNRKAAVGDAVFGVAAATVLRGGIGELDAFSPGVDPKTRTVKLLEPGTRPGERGAVDGRHHLARGASAPSGGPPGQRLRHLGR